MVIVTFSILKGSNFFWVNVAQKIKIISLSSDFVRRLILMSKIQRCCPLLIFLAGNQNPQVKLKFSTYNHSPNI